jgi:hypothetical protein
MKMHRHNGVDDTREEPDCSSLTAIRSPWHLNEMKSSPTPSDVETNKRLDVALARIAQLEGHAVEGRGECSHKSIGASKNFNVGDDT